MQDFHDVPADAGLVNAIDTAQLNLRFALIEMLLYKRPFFFRQQCEGRSYKDKFFIPVQGCLIETEQTHYIEFYRDKERWRYLQKLDADNLSAHPRYGICK